MAIVSPIHIEAVGLANLRFFAPPTRRREFPYVSVDDLHACLSLPRDLRRELKSKLRDTKWRDDARAVGTADGVVNLVPHFMAQGLIHAMQDIGQCPDGFHERYCVAGATAMNKLLAGLSPEGRVAYLEAAWANVGGKPVNGGANAS